MIDLEALWARWGATAIRAGVVLGALLLAIDAAIGRESYFPGEGLPGFYALLAGAASVAAVVLARGAERLISREERYEDD